MFCFLCFTSSVSFTGSYIEVKPNYYVLFSAQTKPMHLANFVAIFLDRPRYVTHFGSQREGTPGDSNNLPRVRNGTFFFEGRG